ncbi:MAG TPA: cytochrome-c peroxidase [Polyangiaceae bacterium]|nr:cytochrome-c peroxidase [Polyangiaceae bacterium]
MKLRSGTPLFAMGLLACGSITDEFGKPGSGASSGPSSPNVDSPTSPPEPTDTRAVQTALTAPPPISGGTLLITRDGTLAVAADPDRDRVSIVRLDSGTVVATLPLSPGDEPGRVVEDGNQRVHVALRRGNAVATIDLTTQTVVSRTDVCGSPRGIAYDASTDLVHVACATGDLVSLPAAGGAPVRRLTLDVDLRDVVVRPGGGLFVSRFKSGDLLSVDVNGAVTSRAKLSPIERTPSVISMVPSSAAVDPMAPAVAWRTIGAPDGSAVMLHQYGLASIIKLSPGQSSSSGGGPTVAPIQSSPYGAPLGTCGGLVQPAVTQISADGVSVDMGAPIIAGVLTVDTAISPDGNWVALAHAGLRDPNAPVSSDGSEVIGANDNGVTLLSRTGLAMQAGAPTGCIQPTTSFPINGQVTAVAFNPSGTSMAVASSTWIAVQSREPAGLSLFRTPGIDGSRFVSLGGRSVLDTGHEMFHRDAGGGIACASCHAEGGEDGRVWRFDPIGDRRTQAVHVGLKGTEPFHWDGDMTNFNMLVDEVMVRRMGGAPQGAARKTALENWLFSLTPPAPVVAANDSRAVHGRAIFESAEAGCSGCHSGPHLTSNQSVYVGTTEAGHLLQVPSLHGVAYRAPFLHDGCAATLRDRFDPGCGGGDQHGHTSQLSDGDVDDLIAYLESL